MNLTTDEIGRANARLQDEYPEDVLAWTFDTFGADAVTGTGFGPSGVALMHMLSRVNPGATVFYLDTDLLFPQTYELKRRLENYLDIRIVRVHSELSLPEQEKREGPNLWRTNPDRCCFLRKVQPLRRFLALKDAWITAIRRDQSPTRRNVGVVEWDPVHTLVKINPMASWTERDTWRYVNLYDLPYNPLHDHGYPSIGCIPCTKPVGDPSDLRAGRWQGHDKLECGIHSTAPAYREHACPPARVS